MEQIKAPDGYEIVDREKEPDAVIGEGWIWWAGKAFGWKQSVKPGLLTDCHSDCIYARPIRKRTLWVLASERQPPLGRTVLVCHDQIQTVPAGSWRRYHKYDNVPSRYRWYDLDAAEAIEAERDRLAAENTTLRADNSFLNEAINDAIKDRDHFEAEADGLRARIAKLERERDELLDAMVAQSDAHTATLRRITTVTKERNQ